MRKLLLTSVLICAPLAGTSSTLRAQDYALERLNNSPRHHEWVETSVGERTLRSFVVYPERSDDAMAVIVIHENRGLTDWVRSFADQVAEAGYLAIAPDLLSDVDSLHAATRDFESEDAARTALYELDPDQITEDLRAIQAHAADMAAGNGKVAVIGFCWGGSQSFRFATNTTGLAAALVFYGTAPTEAGDFERVAVPVFGFYGEDDQRVNATIEATRAHMEAAGKAYDVEIYPGAGHAFMRRGDDPADTSPNRAARDAAWERVHRVLGAIE